MLLTLELRASARCDACSVRTPLLGPERTLACRHCGAEIDLAKKAADARQGGLRYPFGGYYDAVAEAALLLPEGADCKDARNSHGFPVALRRVAGPACAACEQALPSPAPGASELVCGCGERAAVRGPDDETAAWDPRIAWVVGGKRGARLASEREAHTEGAVVRCGGCGAPLQGPRDDRRRARPCGHCGAVNVLGDAAFRALVPQPEWHRSFLVYELDEAHVLGLYDALLAQEGTYFLGREAAARLRARRDAARGAMRARRVAAAARGELRGSRLEALLSEPALTDEEAQALDPRLDDAARARVAPRAPPALLRRWARAASPSIRALVASHPAADEALLSALAGDAEPSVRAAAAARPELPAELLARLRKDPDARVVARVRENPSYVPGFFEKLFG